MTNKPSHPPGHTGCVHCRAKIGSSNDRHSTCKFLQHRFLENDMDLSDSRYKYEEFEVNMVNKPPLLSLQLNIFHY